MNNPVMLLTLASVWYLKSTSFCECKLTSSLWFVVSIGSGDATIPLIVLEEVHNLCYIAT